MTAEQNKALVRRFYKAFEDYDMDALNEVLAPDLVAYNPHLQNHDEYLQGIRGWNTIFSKNHFEILDQIAEGDSVATRIVMRFVHSKAAYQGVPPSGEEIEVPAITIERIKDGKIVERRIQSDRLGMLQQFGLVPSQRGSR